MPQKLENRVGKKLRQRMIGELLVKEEGLGFVSITLLDDNLNKAIYTSKTRWKDAIILAKLLATSYEIGVKSVRFTGYYD